MAGPTAKKTKKPAIDDKKILLSQLSLSLSHSSLFLPPSLQNLYADLINL